MLAAIVSQNSLVLVFVGYRTIIAQYVAKWGIAQMSLCETKYRGGGGFAPFWGAANLPEKVSRDLWYRSDSQYRAIWVGDKFGESLGGSRAPPSFWKVPEVPRKFPKLPRKFFGDFPKVLSLWNLTAIQGFPGSFPDFSGSSPDFPGGFPNFPGGQPLRLFLGSLTPSLDSQKLSLNGAMNVYKPGHYRGRWGSDGSHAWGTSKRWKRSGCKSNSLRSSGIIFAADSKERPC